MQDKHLFFLIHGLGGNPGHMKAIETALVAQFKSGTLVHVATSNSGLRTMEGAVLGADRLCHELLALVTKLAKEGVKVSRLSIVGYSFGGVLGRYLIGMLQELGFFDHVEPYLFSTFATPHLGSMFSRSSWRGRTLNFFGSRLLGLTGRDLFCTNNLLVDLADPNQMYFRGLKRFKHHVLFANGTFDRTVPFWTSFITTKNPFYRRNHLELKYFDHLHGQSYSTIDEAKVPFLVDMERSRYSDLPTNDFVGLSPVEKRQRILFGSLLPFFFPVLLGILLVGTLTAHIRSKRAEVHDHAESWQLALEKMRGDLEPTELERLENRFSQDLADIAGQMMENIVISSNKGYGNGDIQPSQVTQGLAEPHVKFGGLEEQVPWEVQSSPGMVQAMENLNTIAWHKYAVKLRHLNAHAEIVNRRRSKSQGSELVAFFARMAGRLVKADAEAKIE